ncbi:MAG: GPW/gp25 family protein [Proteobacteria bacterium]|nr:GPW/gp25 family protein [Pseudomonadota bacterium]
MAYDIKNTKESRYSDFDFDFEAHPRTGNLILKKDIAAVSQSVRNLVQTNRFERLFQPEINGKVRRMLFELITPATAVQLRSHVKDVLQQHEPRINVVDVVVVAKEETNYLTVTITYLVKTTNDFVSTDIILKRTR